MDMRQLKLENRSRVLESVRSAASTPFGGVNVKSITQGTQLCLRTVQTHLRELRADGIITNRKGLWVALEL